MQITSEHVEPRQVRLTIVVPESRVERAMTEVAEDLGRRMKLPGYRPGKVPVRVVIARVGEEQVREDALEKVANDAVRDAIVSEGLTPVAPASVEITERSPLTLNALVPLAPDVNLGNYRDDLRVEAPQPAAVTDEDVTAVFDNLRADLATLEPVERPIASGDMVTVELVGRQGDKIVFEDEELTLRVDPSGAAAAHVPEAVVEALPGLDVDDKLQLTATYPDDWAQPELRGANVDFEGRVTSIRTVSLPELNDDLAAQVSNAESLLELHERVRDTLTRRAQSDASSEHVEQIIGKLVEMAQVAFPPALLDDELAREMGELRARVEKQGFRWDRWIELQRRTEDQLWEDLEPVARNRLIRRLVLAAFVRNEGLQLRAAEVDDVVRQIRAAAEPSARKKLPKDDELREEASTRMLADRTFRRLLDIAEGRGAPEPAAPPGPATSESDESQSHGAEAPRPSAEPDAPAPAGVEPS